MKKILIVIAIAAIVSGGYRTHAADNPVKPEEQKKTERPLSRGSAGVLCGITMAGVQAEYTPLPELGIRAVGLGVFGAGFNKMNRGEFILSGILAPVLHLAPKSRIIDPLLMIGLVYSYHHWETRASELGINRRTAVREGAMHDVTVGAGFGILFRFADRFKAGLTLWLNYDYGVETTLTFRKKKGNRLLFPFPIAECTVQF